ncbi:hypothetical protein NLX83_18145 [Allokutzneria sp. A3M-2-11 16]|uniref:hypothetical protein n=1 Tax=Allokutzneria sp. A3M-2-11 16 TaxID=2962043 RepID=UPI0020B8AC8A|nr:hypothetical protein [Allokutzneria sp. A3M-2-11 16]MCP3801184.1 hypothetical protein [Allokutzneria sp. A3M-2-11 16]
MTTRNVLRALEFVAYPALAGAAFFVLSIGVVTWLPALAAAAVALQQWRVDGDARCFLGVFKAFPACWRSLWQHSVVSTAVIAVLAANVMFLADRPEQIAFVLLAAQVGFGLVLIPYHLVLAAQVAVGGEARPKAVLVTAFGSLAPCLGLTAVVVLALALASAGVFAPLLWSVGTPVLLALRFVPVLVFDERTMTDEPCHSPALRGFLRGSPGLRGARGRG